MLADKKYNSIVIAGPTASGKTALAVKTARIAGGEIISADSRQVYRGMDIGSGKDLSEYTEGGPAVKVHLVDCANPDEVYSLYNYLHDFYPCFDGIIGRGNVPVVCGGTGLYIEGALLKYAVSDAAPDENLRKILSLKSREDLIEDLNSYPDIYKNCDLSSKKRIIRAIEIAQSCSGKPVSPGENTDIRPMITVVSPPTDILKKRISHRLDERLAQGMLDEVRTLLESGVSRERMIMFGMEYKYVSLYLDGDINYNTMRESLLNEIFRLAKRQRTWFRGMKKRGLDVLWFESVMAEELAELFNAS
ncbi:MAG: tRNA (adenosine(37)-N6)-dimethylallyltransferase MiaA [Spirochaetes bacterium]|nr:tRNA (adenosine(37)-N6)-dimethylallyltransferase MiaA [Spirochaetota bacterium]MBN2771344.1 tRNA (adenosine(37)-N6)-dimethylallyltransferase MiaA [Spirochaetota bacterium]